MNQIVKVINYTLATGLGAGYAPWAPGTVGSLLALVFIWLLWPASLLWQMVILLVCIAVGVWVSSWTSKDAAKKDPSFVVIDEIAGIFFTFLLVPVNTTTLVAGFILFRIFDIWKPGPIGQLEKLPSGWGIMMDDILSGMVSCLILHVSLYGYAL